MRRNIFSFFRPSAWDVLGVITTLGPIVIASLSAIIGWLEGISLLWIIVAVSFIFAGTSVGMLRFDEWLYRRKIADKITFSRIRLGKKLTDSGEVKEILFGFELQNKALFPIEFYIEELETHIGDKYPQKRPYSKKNIIIPEQGLGWFDDHFIEIPNPPKGQSLEGGMILKLSYGRPGRLIYKFERKFRVFAGFDKNGDIIGVNWIEC